MKNTKVYLMSTENVKDPRTFALWKEFLPKEHWEKTVRPLKEEDRKTELAAWFLLYQALREWGISEEKIAQVHNPIGLPIKGVTPPEIAVSILAELILTKRTKKTDGKVQTELDYEVLSEWLAQSRPCAMATILKAQGSSPRKEGAKMLIFENKSILGSVGGGLVESKVIEKGCEIIGSGKAFLFHFVMDADVAARAGMACGGTFDILIEDVKF